MPLMAQKKQVYRNRVLGKNTHVLLYEHKTWTTISSFSSPTGFILVINHHFPRQIKLAIV